MALKRLVERFTKPVEELDRERLEDFCSDLCDDIGAVRIDEVEPRSPVKIAGEVRSVRIVPRAGADALEVIVSDGRGAVTAVFLGRRKIHGLTPGRRVVLEGVVGSDGRQLLIYNPLYVLV